MTFLKRLGSILAQGIAIATGFGPLIAPFLGAKASAVVTTATNDLTAIGQVVVQVEAILQGPGRGAEKLAAATPLIASVVRTSELVSGHKIADENLFIKGCSDLASAVAEILNSLAPKIDTSGDPLPLPIPTAKPVVSA
jgi:hypothetical protein